MNEYKMNGFLAKHGISTPKVYYVNLEGRLLLQQYIEGGSFEEVIRRIFSQSHNVREDLSLVHRLALLIAEIHSLNVTIGDCKPENIILSPDDEIYFVDLEQAGKGNPTWDIAEFLYYTGHYTVEKEKIMPIIEVFIEGYIENGDAQYISDAGSLSYIRVFSFFTAPNILMEISNACSKQ
ncbi:MAG: aminoglycoside phosphotransferase family protein, partial [Candidatus Bathyarchaeota archaeon]|nr:aminoglycoside phosphotransferase family protein [Candidatus Bathyarchaeota archaeon]